MPILIKLTDHSSEVLAAMESQVAAGLESCGMIAENHAKDYITSQEAYDTGDLKKSIKHEVRDNRIAVIGTAKEYAIYVEMGTGIYVGGGRDTPWAFRDKNGNWHMTRGMPERPFMKPAVADHVDEYRGIMEMFLRR